MSLKQRIIKTLEENNLTELLVLAGKERGIFRILISLAYDKEELLCWRAIEGLGAVAGEVARREPETVRNLVGRLLWTVREESGGIGWSAPEMLAEIVRNCPDTFSDIAPIIVSFHDEVMLRQGVLRGVVRIGEVRPDLFRLPFSFIGSYLRDTDPSVRAYSARIVGMFRLKENSSDIEYLLQDNSVVRFYKDGNFQETTVGSIAEEAIRLLRKGGN